MLHDLKKKKKKRIEENLAIKHQQIFIETSYTPDFSLFANSFLEKEKVWWGELEEGESEGERSDVNLISSPVYADTEYDL